nr:putative ribonuclease H-like domain-containing protein [Tanacetum cinerariifolium]
MIRCDNGTKFKNRDMNQFCEIKGIIRHYSVARTPQQNRVDERRNMTLIEAARTMLADSKLPTTFWAKAVSTACYVQNSEPAVETLNAKTSEDVPKVVKKDNGAPIIKDWKSDDEDESVPQPKIEKK